MYRDVLKEWSVEVDVENRNKLTITFVFIFFLLSISDLRNTNPGTKIKMEFESGPNIKT